MTGDSVPGNCKDCPHASENAYTKGWYCELSGAPLGSKRALEFCTCSAPKASAGVPHSTEDSAAARPSTPAPEAPTEATPDNPAPQQQNAAADLNAPVQAAGGPAVEEDLIYGHPFDSL